MASNPLRTAQTIGFSTALFFSGFSYATSALTLPPLYSLPASTSTPAFAHVFYQGARHVLPIAVLSALANCTVAYLSNDTQAQALHVAAAVSIVSTQPWTRVVMWDGIQRLLEVSRNTGRPENQTEAKDKEVVELLKAWTWQNTVRAALGALSAALAIYAAY